VQYVTVSGAHPLGVAAQFPASMPHTDIVSPPVSFRRSQKFVKLLKLTGSLKKAFTPAKDRPGKPIPPRRIHKACGSGGTRLLARIGLLGNLPKRSDSSFPGESSFRSESILAQPQYACPIHVAADFAWLSIWMSSPPVLPGAAGVCGPLLGDKGADGCEEAFESG
jgi:hypothetical protein